MQEMSGIADKRTLLDEIESFDAQFQELSKDYPGRWIVMCEGGVAGDFKTFEAAEEFAQRELGDRPYLIEIADKKAYSPSATVWFG